MGRRAGWVRKRGREGNKRRKKKQRREGRPPQEGILNQSYRIETWGESVQTTNQNSQTKKNFSFLSFPPSFFLSVSFAFCFLFISSWTPTQLLTQCDNRCTNCLPTIQTNQHNSTHSVVPSHSSLNPLLFHSIPYSFTLSLTLSLYLLLTLSFNPLLFHSPLFSFVLCSQSFRIFRHKNLSENCL